MVLNNPYLSDNRMKAVHNENLGFGSLHILGFNFKGIFQLRLATDADVSDEARGQSGWTFAYGDEPNLDRIIRFNRPVAHRSFTPSVGVNVTEAYIDDQQLKDSIVGQAINLGPHSYFDGSNGADGHEPIIDFEFHVGNNNNNNKDYLYCEATKPPVGNGIHLTRNPLPMTFEALRNSRTTELQTSNNMIDQQRLKNINRSLNPIYSLEVTYEATLDKNIKFNAMDSQLVKSMEQRQVNNLSLSADFYGYDGDGLIGYVIGNVAAEFR
jgi:hypothetical protein